MTKKELEDGEFKWIEQLALPLKKQDTLKEGEDETEQDKKSTRSATKCWSDFSFLPSFAEFFGFDRSSRSHNLRLSIRPYGPSLS